MIHLRFKSRRGFTLTELAIVLGVIGAIIGSLWQFAGAAQAKLHLHQAQNELNIMVEAIRTAYAPEVGIMGDETIILPYLNQTAKLGAPIIRSASSACNGVTSYYADSPWPATYDACGSLHVCAWSYGTDTGCAALSAGAKTSPMPVFAIEFSQMSYSACVTLTQAISPYMSSGLKDVYINARSVKSMALSGSLSPPLPVPPAIAQSRGSFANHGCLTAGANIVDFVYQLRTPVN